MLRSILGCLLFWAFALVGPGLAVQRLLARAWDLALVVPAGLAVSAAAYWASLVVGWPALFPIAVLTLDLTLLLPRRGPWRPAEGPRIRTGLPTALALVAVLAAAQYRGNRFAADGSFLLDPFVAADTAFHVGLTRELTLDYPPQVPGVAGFPLAYHLGTDLVRAAALRWARVDPYDMISRLDATLFALALLLTVRAAASALGGPPLAIALAGWSLLATDFSFLFAADPEAHWWADLLRGNALISIALANPVVPGLALVLGALLSFDRHQRGQGAGWLALAVMLAAAVPFFKVFLGAHLLLGLGAAFVFGKGRRSDLVWLALPCALATGALAFGSGAATVAVRLAPLDLVQATRGTLGLPPAAGLSLLVWAGLWLAASLGLRLVGLREATRALTAPAVLSCALAAMALAAWPLGLAFRVGAPELLERERAVNDAAYLVEQGGVLLWLFAARALAGLAGASGRQRLVVALAALLALPSTIHFVVTKALLPLDPVPGAAVRAVRVAEANTRPGDVILQRPGARYPPLPVILATRRVPYERFTPYLTQFARPADLEGRHQAVHRFFRTEDPREALELAHELGTSVLILYGTDGVRFDPAGTLHPLHVEPGARVYRLTSP